jgi:hypothetical protein
MTEATTTADATHRYNPEKATLCTSIFDQLVGLGSDKAAFIRAITQPPMKKVSARVTGSVFV